MNFTDYQNSQIQPGFNPYMNYMNHPQQQFNPLVGQSQYPIQPPPFYQEEMQQPPQFNQYPPPPYNQQNPSTSWKNIEFSQPRYRQQSVDEVINDMNVNQHQIENINTKHTQMLQNIEHTMGQEKDRARDTRMQLVSDLEKETRIRKDLEIKLRKLAEDMNEKQHLINEIQIAFGQCKEENQQLHQQLQHLKQEIIKIEDEKNKKDKFLEDQLRQVNWKAQQQDKKFRHEIERLKQDNQFALDSLDKQWNFNFKAQQEKCTNFQNIKQSLENELLELQNELHKTRLLCEEELKEKVIFIQEEESLKYQSNLKALESKLRSCEDALQNLSGKNKVLIDDIANKDRLLKEQDLNITNAINHYQQQIVDLQNEQTHLSIQRDNLIREVNKKENNFRKIETENEDLRTQMSALRNQCQGEQSELENQLSNTRVMCEEQNNKFQMKINELEQINHELQSEIEGWQTEHDRLRQLLQNNINKTIDQVVSNNAPGRQNDFTNKTMKQY